MEEKTYSIIWYKTNPKAIIPTKRDEDAGYDIYTTEDNIALAPHKKHLFATGIKAAIEPGIWLMGADRGSTGSKGLHIHCGIVDSGYRGEIFICLCNDNDYPVFITSEVEKVTMTPQGLYYPTSKAIAQLVPMLQPTIAAAICLDEKEWENRYCNTERGETKLGQSGK